MSSSLTLEEVQNFLQKRQLLKFNYSVQYGSPFAAVSSLSSVLHYTDPSYLLAVNRVCYEFNNTVLQNIGEALVPERALIFTAIPEVIISPSKQKEPYFNTTYTDEPISQDDLDYFHSDNFPSMKI